MIIKGGEIDEKKYIKRYPRSISVFKLYLLGIVDYIFKIKEEVMLNEGLKRCIDCDLYPNNCGYWDKQYRKKNPNLPKKADNHNCDYFKPIKGGIRL